MNEENKPTEWTIDDVIESLTNDRHDNIEPRVPEGVTDLSHLLAPIRALCARGRLLKSNHDYDIGRFIGELLSVLSRNRDEMGLQVAVLWGMILREARNVEGNVSMEEFLMRALSPDRFDAVMLELKSVPIVHDTLGRLRPNFASLPIFFRPQQITSDMIKGFTRRWLRPTLPYLFPDDDVASPDDDNEPSVKPVGGIRVIDASEVVGDSDPLDGFDEYHDYFYEVEVAAYEQGCEMEELDGLTPDSDPGPNTDILGDRDSDTGLY